MRNRLFLSWFLLAAVSIGFGLAIPQTASLPIPVGTTRQLFVDNYLIDRQIGVSLKLHNPIPREIVLEPEKPWEGSSLTYVSVFKDGKRYLMYYRASGGPIQRTGFKGKVPSFWNYTAVAESIDGLRWTRPNLGIVDFMGSRQNNLVWPVQDHPACKDDPPRSHSLYCQGSDIFPFRDDNPNARAEERYKALATISEYELIALGSPDGIHWHKIQQEPVFSYLPDDPMMDPPSLAFWDEFHGQYVAYLRTWINYRIRGFRRSTSSDFRIWTKPEYVDLGDSEVEHLYTNMTVPYDRALGIYLMFAKRFVTWRTFDPKFGAPGLSEVVFLSSRDGVRFERTFMEPYLSPGLDNLNWRARGIMAGRGLLQLSPDELSLYYVEHYPTDTVRVRRAAIRPDGFISVHAPFAGGEFTTKPLTFKGGDLEINYASSVAGSIRVEIQDANGKPIPGFRLEECDEIFGDELGRIVTWRRGHKEVLSEDRTKEILNKPSDLSRALGGRTIRIRFVMKSADLFSFIFR